MSIAAALTRRMAGPQRHRLLQGYPAVPLMRHAAPDLSSFRGFDGALTHGDAPEPPFITIDPTRKLILGVIPHTQCTPKVRGCGFCTFGQDPYRRSSMTMATSQLRVDVEGIRAGRRFAGRNVAAVYFGGGTANLTPVRDLDSMFTRLAEIMNLRDAELTLEGVPSLFVSRFSAALRWLAKLPVRQKRVSMGVQTFDSEQLRRMGRDHFGDAALVARVVREARQRGIGTSGDFLFNLPHQSRAQMLADVERAVEIGFDQICVYHLVLYEGLGTVWSRDPEMIAALPGNDEAAENWLAVREALLSAGYVQTTLTNFERADIHASDRRFMYEELSFSPGEVDGLGIGPLSLSTFVDWDQGRAVKLLRSRETNASGQTYGHGDFYFPYAAEDLELLWLTRTLPRLRWSGAGYHGLFGRAIEAEYGDVVAAIVEAGLAAREGEDVVLTGRGMFYADAIAGVVAEQRAAALREGGAGVHNRELLQVHYHMG
jgi:coproporphyrinogen III oxidase-like Fe-S oxidoreductase